MDRNKKAVAIFDLLAGLYQDKYMDVSQYRDSLDFFCRLIEKKGASILELACGPGNITHYVSEKRPDFKILGTDLSQNMLNLAKTNNPGTKFQILDCRKANTLRKVFDAAVCGFCLPYLSKKETVKLVSDISRLLVPGGVFYLSSIEGDHAHSGLKTGSTGDQIFMHYYDADFLIDLLKQNNFKILSLERKIYRAPDGSITTDLIIISQK